MSSLMMLRLGISRCGGMYGLRAVKNGFRPPTRRFMASNLLRQLQTVPRCTRGFHTSGLRPAPFPLALLGVISPRIGAFISTRLIRRFVWPRLSQETRNVIKKLLILSGGLLYSGLAVYAWAHVDIVEETGRRR